MQFGKYAFDRVGDFLSHYKYVDFVLAMRGHGQIVPLGFNKPVISLENHDKHRGLMEDYALGSYNVNVLDIDFSSKLDGAIINLETNYFEISTHIKQRNSYLLSQTKKELCGLSELSKYVRDDILF